MSRPRSVLGFPGRNRKSSSSSIPKSDLTETSEEKARYKINTKADPSRAMNEAQPSVQAALDKNTMGSIRDLEHRDADGNLITDADRSNPTRPRLERPLDTIRSFEAAIDGSYNRRQSFRADSSSPVSPQNNRRSIYMNAGYQQQPQSRTQYDNGRGVYYSNRNSMSQVRHNEDDVYGGPPSQYNSGRRFGPRNNSDPALYGHTGNQGVYPSHGYQQSYDTVNTASNQSHATDQWGNSTDPSSENSSIDRVQPQPPPKPDLGEAYGFNGFGAGPQLQGPILEEHGLDAPGYGQPGYGGSQASNTNGHPYQGNDAPPSVPAHGAPVPPPKTAGPRVPIKLGPSANVSTNSQYNPKYAPSAADKSEKRKSWIKKRFSKS